jgi:hypothetical protein
MNTPVPELTKSQRLRLRFFHFAAGVLLFFSVLAIASLGVGVYFTVTSDAPIGWFFPILFLAMGLALSLMVRICVRALRIKSIAELEQQNESRWVPGGTRPSSPNPSLERP